LEAWSVNEGTAVSRPRNQPSVASRLPWPLTCPVLASDSASIS